MSYFVNTPFLIKRIFPNIIWAGKKGEKVIYLTFDDSPNSVSTHRLLQLLEVQNIKATFFCLGKNVEENMGLYEQILKPGHSIGNHSYSHINAWRHTHKDFIKDVEKANSIIHTNLFRPPYGRLKWKDYRLLRKKYQIVLWSMMPGDWDSKLDKNKLLKRMKKYLSPRAIYVLHDSSKSIEKLEFALPVFIQYAMDKGYSFKSL